MKNKITMFLLVCFIVASHLQRDYNFDLKGMLVKTFKNSAATISKKSILTTVFYKSLVSLTQKNLR
jgi:hypothetical protein